MISFWWCKTNNALGDENVEQIIAAGFGYKTLQISQNKADLYLHTTKIRKIKVDTCACNALLNAVGSQLILRRKLIILSKAIQP